MNRSNLPSPNDSSTKALSIVHFVTMLDIGGLERMVLALAREQKRRGHSVTIGCLFGDGVLAGQARDAGIAVFSCDKRPGPDWRVMPKIRRALRAAGAQVLHTHNSMPHYYATAAALGLGLRRIISTRHNMGTDQYTARGEALYKLAMKATDRAVSVCRAAQDRFVASGVIRADKALTIVNGIEVERFRLRNDASRAQLALHFGLAEADLLLTTVGRLGEVKNHALMLRALKLSRERGANAALLVVGDGPMRAGLEALTAELNLDNVVRFAGARDDIAELLAGSDGFIQSSITEGYSLALVEASCAGLPIIATDVGGNAEIVQRGVTGLLVAANDVAGMAAAIARLSGDLPERLRMGGAARDWAMRNGSLETMYTAYLSIYQDSH